MDQQIKTLADELRKSIIKPTVKVANKDPVRTENGKTDGKKNNDFLSPEIILSKIRSHDCSQHSHMLHPRFDGKTVQLLASFKLASGIDMNRMIAYAVHYLFQQHPELKNFIKQSLENFEL